MGVRTVARRGPASQGQDCEDHAQPFICVHRMRHNDQHRLECSTLQPDELQFGIERQRLLHRRALPPPDADGMVCWERRPSVKGTTQRG